MKLDVGRSKEKEKVARRKEQGGGRSKEEEGATRKERDRSKSHEEEGMTRREKKMKTMKNKAHTANDASFLGKMIV